MSAHEPRAPVSRDHPGHGYLGHGHPEPGPSPLAAAAVFAAPAVFVVLWASGFVGALYGLPYAGPMTFLTVRMGGVIALLAVIIAVTRPAWPSRMQALHSAVTGLCVHGLYLGGVFVAVDQNLPAGLCALVVSLQPILTSTLANRLLGERVRPRQWAGLVLGLGGVYLVLQGHDGGNAPWTAWAASVVALIGITTGTLYQKRFGGSIEWRTGLLIQYLAAGALFALIAFATESMSVQWSAEFVFAIVWLVFVLSLGAVWLLYFLIRKQAATRVVSLFYLTPPVTALMAWLLFDQQLSPQALLGMAVCVAGVALVNWRIGGSGRKPA